MAEYLIWDFALAFEGCGVLQIRSNPLTPCIVTSVQHSFEAFVPVLLPSNVGSIIHCLWNTFFPVHKLHLNLIVSP